MSTKKIGIVAGIVLTLSVVISPAFAACSLSTLSECDNTGLMALIVQMLGSSSTTTTTTTTTTGTISGIPAGFTFTTNLAQGSTGNDVKYLQILLNSDTATSVGNAGSETSYFGSMTKAAVVKFQNKYANEVLAPYGLAAGTGFFGSSSRAKANALLGAGISTGTLPAGCTSSTGFSTTTGQSCAGTVTLPAGCTSSSNYSSTTGQPCGTGTTVVTGAFTVGLASNNPVSGTFVQGQAIADLAHYTFSNGTATPVVVTSVTLDRIGISADSTLANVYLFDGTTRLTDAASVSTGKITFNATSGIFTVPANSTVTIIVKSDLAASSNGQTIGVALSAVVSNGTLSSTLPIAGNLHNIASATLATVAVSGVLPANTTTDPVAGVRIWESTFTVGNRNVNFTKLALKQINSIDKADISNFQLLVDGTVVSTVASLDANGYVTFTFDKVLTTGSRNVKVLADINGGSSRYVQMSLRNKADIEVKDSEYGVYVSATGLPATAGYLQVNSGVFTITTDNGSLPYTIANNSSNVLIGKWKFKASGEAVKVETLTAGITYTDADANNTNATLRNGKIMINGAQAGSTATLSDLAAGTAYTVNYTFQPGVETTVELYADIFDNDGTSAIESGDTITGKLITGSANGTRQVSLGTINVPTGEKTASALIVTTGSATLAATSNYGTQTTVLPQTAFKIGSWTMVGGTAEDINISNLSFDINSVTNATFTYEDLADMYIVYQVGSNTAVTSSTKPTPTNVNNDFPVSFTLPRTQTATITLYSSILAGGVTALDSARAVLTVTGTGAQSGAAAAFGGAVNGQTIVAANASLTVTRDASSPAAALLASNTTVKTVSYKFEAINDSYTLSQLVFSITDPSAVVAVNLKEGSTILQTRSAAAEVAFNGFATPIVVNANTTKVLDVELVLGNIGAGAGATGADVTTDFVGTTAGKSLARPTSTGITAVITDTGAGNAMYVYKAIPTVSLASLPTASFVPGANYISNITVGSTTGTIAWDSIVFSINKTGVALAAMEADDFKLYDAAGTEITGTFTVLAALNAVGNATGTVRFTPTNEEQLSGSKTYKLEYNEEGTIASGDYISTSIAKPTAAHAPSDNADDLITANAASFIWSDISAQGHDTTTSLDWTTDFLVKNLPTSSQTITK